MLSSISILWENFFILHLTIFELPHKLQLIMCRESAIENQGHAEPCTHLEVQIFLRQKEHQEDTNTE